MTLSKIQISYFVTFLFLLFNTNVLSQEDELYPLEKNQRMGLFDLKGNKIVDPIYIELQKIDSSKLFIANNGKGIGLIDRNGKIIIPCLYDGIDKVEQSCFYKIMLNDSVGIVNPYKNIIIEPHFISCYSHFNNFTARFEIILVSNFRNGILDVEGNFLQNPIVKVDSSVLIFKKNKTIRRSFSNIEALNNNYYLVTSKGKFGVYSLQNDSLQLPLIYNDIDVSNKIGLSKNEIGEFIVKYDTKLGIVDSINNQLLECQYDSIKCVFSHEYIIKSKSKYGFANTQNAFILEPILDTIYSCGNFYKIVKDSLKGFLFSNGKMFLSKNYDSYSFLTDDLLLVTKNNRVGVFNYKKMEEIIKPQYDNISKFSNQNLLSVSLNNSIGIINIENKIILPVIYEKIENISPLFYRVKKGNKYGILNPYGEFVVPCRYLSFQIVLNTNYNTIRIKENDYIQKVFSVDDNGKLIDMVEYNNILSLNLMKRDTINRDFAIPQRPNFRTLMPLISSLSNKNYEWYRDRDTWKWGLKYRNTYTSIRIDPMYENVVKSRHQYQDSSMVEVTRLRSDTIEIANFDDTCRCYSQFRNNNRKNHKTTLEGLVSVDSGSIVLPANNRFIMYDDFKTAHVSRAVQKASENNLLFRLINENGKLIKGKYSFIDNFKNGYSRFNVEGNIACLTDNKKSVEWPLNEKNNFPCWVCDKGNWPSINTYLSVKGGLWGLIDDNGSVIIKPIYTNLSINLKGVLIAEKNKKWGIIRVNGSVIVPFNYDKIERLIDKKTNSNYVDSSFYLAKKNNKYGIIDTLGRVLIDFKYDDIEYWGNDKQEVFVLKTGNQFVLTNKLAVLLNPLKWNTISLQSNGMMKLGIKNPKYGLIDSLGNMLTDAIFDSISIFSDDLVRVKINNEYRFVNKNGQFAFSQSYKDAHDFSEGFAAIKIGEFWGYIDKTGNEVISPLFYEVGDFKNGISHASKMQKKSVLEGYIDTRGFFISKVKYQDCRDFQNSYAFVRIKNKVGIMDTSFKWLINPKFKSISDFSKDSIAKVEFRNGDVGLIHHSGKMLCKLKKRNIISYKDGVIMATSKSNTNWSLFNYSGKLIPLYYDVQQNYVDCFDTIYPFNGNITLAKYNSNYYVLRIVHSIPNVVIEATRLKTKCTECSQFSGGISICRKGLSFILVDSNGYISTKNRKFLSYSMNKTKDYKPFISFLNFKFSYGGNLFPYITQRTSYRVFYLDKDGKNTFNRIFNDATEFEGKISRVKDKICDRWTLFSKDNGFLSIPKFDYISSISNGIGTYRIDYNYALTDKYGRIIFEPEYSDIKVVSSQIIYLKKLFWNGYFTSLGNKIIDSESIR